MMRWLGDLFLGGTKKFKIGERVHIKNDVYSEKRGRRRVYIIDDVCHGDLGSWYQLTAENRCMSVMGPFNDRTLEDAINAPPTPSLEEEYPWLRKSEFTTKGEEEK